MHNSYAVSIFPIVPFVILVNMKAGIEKKECLHIDHNIELVYNISTTNEIKLWNSGSRLF